MVMRMALVFVFAFLFGCAGPRQYGSFVVARGNALAALATDATKRLTQDYPPQDHGIQLVDGAADGFGRALASELRRSGYEVREGDASAGGAMPVRYAVDQLKGTELLRVMLHLQGRKLSRAYTRKADGLHPVGPWAAAGGQ